MLDGRVADDHEAAGVRTGRRRPDLDGVRLGVVQHQHRHPEIVEEHVHDQVEHVVHVLSRGSHQGHPAVLLDVYRLGAGVGQELRGGRHQAPVGHLDVRPQPLREQTPQGCDRTNGILVVVRHTQPRPVGRTHHPSGDPRTRSPRPRVQGSPVPGYPTVPAHRRPRRLRRRPRPRPGRRTAPLRRRPPLCTWPRRHGSISDSSARQPTAGRWPAVVRVR